MPQRKRRPVGRRKRQSDLTSGFYWRMIRNPDRRIPYVLTEEGMRA
jgi:hypothetical protein